MNSRRRLKLAAWLMLPVFAWYLLTHRSYYFNNTFYLMGAIVLELLFAAVWDYRRKYFWVTIIAFLGAGISTSLQDDWGTVRWLVLGVGAMAGWAIYMKDGRQRLNTLHWMAICCVLAAVVSATVSSYPQVAILKAASFLLLFVYGISGARLAMLGREEIFFNRLLMGGEILVYSSAVAYFIFHWEFWGNPNSLGVVMSVAALPLLLWGTITSPTRNIRRRRAFALFLALLLLLRSYERAGMVATIVASLFLCIPLRQYRLLIKGAVLALLCAIVIAAFVPMVSQDTSDNSSLVSKFVYKEKPQNGILGSRQTVWDETLSSLQQHPWFGTGFGTSGSSQHDAETSMTYSNFYVKREHGNSYLAVIEWTGLLGVTPFFVLVALLIRSVVQVGIWMYKTADPYSYAIPLAAVVAAGLVNAAFEDWLFAVGYHACVFFWILALALPDFLPAPKPAISEARSRAYSPAIPQPLTSPIIASSHASVY